MSYFHIIVGFLSTLLTVIPMRAQDKIRVHCIDADQGKAANDAQRYTTRFTSRGIRLRPRGAAIEVELELTGPLRNEAAEGGE